MTSPLPTSVSTPVDSTAIPPQVRAEGQKAETLYGTALSFEQLLVQQLSQGLTDASQTDDSSDDDSDSTDDGSSTSPSSDPVTSQYQDMLPNALSQSVTSAGGTGLAIDLYRSMGGLEATPAALAATALAPTADPAPATETPGL